MCQCEVSIAKGVELAIRYFGPWFQLFPFCPFIWLQRGLQSVCTICQFTKLKFAYKQGRLDFTPDLIAHEKDYGISGPVSKRVFDELMANEAYSELDKLFANETDEL